MALFKANILHFGIFPCYNTAVQTFCTRLTKHETIFTNVYRTVISHYTSLFADYY